MPGTKPTAVLENLPHRAPFRFLSSIEHLQPGRCGNGVWHLSGGEDFFSGHFPGNPVVPGVLLAEALAQLSGLVAFTDDSDAPPVPARLAQLDVKFQSPVVPPASIHLESSLRREMGGLCLFVVTATVNGTVVASGSLVLVKVP